MPAVLKFRHAAAAVALRSGFLMVTVGFAMTCAALGQRAELPEAPAAAPGAFQAAGAAPGDQAGQGAGAAAGQSAGSGSVRGTVTDPDGDLVPGAMVTVTPAKGKAYQAASGSDGTYSVKGIPAGIYSITVTIPGFATYVQQGVRIAGALVVNPKLAIENAKQEVTVTAQPAGVSVDPENNASSTILTGAALDALSDDPDELSDQLTALAGPAAGPNGGQIYIDGFTGGELPPKSSIREIRINQNPFSAEYDKVGYGRIEIFTKPGTDKFHGFLNIQGNDSVLNTTTPFLNGSTGSPTGLSSGTSNSVQATQPNYYTLFGFGSFSGPINKHASFTVSGSRRSIQVNTLINPEGFYSTSADSTVLCPAGNGTAPAAGCSFQPLFPLDGRAIPQPTIRQDISPRVDLAIGANNTLTVRYLYENASQINQGLGTDTLASAGSTTGNTENTIQISDTQSFGAKVVNEIHIEYQRDSSFSNPNSTAPQISVQGVLTGGGTNTGTTSTTGAHEEFQNYTSIALAHNFIRFGGRLRSTNENFTADSGANGTFTYSFLLDPCVAGSGDMVTGCVNTTTPCSAANALSNAVNGGTYYSSYQCGLASQFNYTKINNPLIKGRETDVGLYAEDDWKPKTNLTLTYGVRLEAQNNINSAHDFAPRVSVNYGIPHKGGPITVLRGGYGIFFDRFALSDTLTAERLNGLNQVTYTYNYPGASCLPQNVTPGGLTSPGNFSACTSGATATPALTTTYTQAPDLRSSYNSQVGVGVDQSIGKLGTISVNYLNTRGVHQFFSRAYVQTGPTGLPGAYMDQFDSGGIYKQNQIIVNGRVNHGRYSIFGYYALNFADGNTNGADTFLTSPDATKIDYGRSAFSRRNQGALIGNIQGPYKFSFAPFMIIQSGQPYNVTTGVDNNQDGQFNDRPSFMPGQDSANCFVSSTFDTTSQSTTENSIPINYCTGPMTFTFNLRITRTFGFGPRTAQAAGQQGGGPGGGGGSHSHGFGGGPGGGGHGSPFSNASTGRKYNVALGAQASNLFNVIPYANPISQLTSSRFGTFDALQNGLAASGTAVRQFRLQATFSF